MEVARTTARRIFVAPCTALHTGTLPEGRCRITGQVSNPGWPVRQNKGASELRCTYLVSTG